MTDRRGFLKSLFAVPLIGRFGAGEVGAKTVNLSPMKLMKGVALGGFTPRKLPTVLSNWKLGQHFDTGEFYIYPEIEQIPWDEITPSDVNYPTNIIDPPSLLQSDLCPFTNTYVVNVLPDTMLFSRFETTVL